MLSEIELNSLRSMHSSWIALFVDELQRSRLILAALEAELIKLPKGSIQQKCIKEKMYSYLFWRDGSKICSRYVKASELPHLEEKLARRKHIKERVANLRQEIALAERLILLRAKM